MGEQLLTTILVQNHDTVRNDLADLYSVRYVSASEVQDGQRF